MLRLEPGHRRHRLDDIHPVHRLAFFVPMPLRIASRHRQEPRMRNATQEVRIERKNDVRLFQLVLRIGIAAERRLRSRARRVLIHRLPLHQLRLRISRLHLLPLRRQRRRRNRLAQEINSLSAIGLLRRSRKRLLKLTPARNLSAIQHMLRAVRIVQIQQRRLRKRIRLALRHRMLRIALHLDRPERIRLHQHRNRARRERIRRRKVHRLAQNQILRLLDIRKDRLIRLLRATRQPSQRQRRAHHLQKAAPAHRIDPLARTRLPRKLLAHQLVERRRLGQLIQVLPEAPPRLAVQLRADLSQRQLRRAAIWVTTTGCVLLPVLLSQPSSLLFQSSQ